MAELRHVFSRIKSILPFILCILLVYMVTESNIPENGGPLRTMKDMIFQEESNEGRLNIYNMRRQLVRQNCENINRTKYDSLKIRNNIKIDPVHNIRYCPIPKVGTTFWVRTLTVLSSRGRLKSPFEIGRSGANLIYWTKLSDEQKKVYASGGQSLIFVRDPYSRLFSGYENKLYVSNLVYWKSLGRKIIKAFRSQPDPENEPYGCDVTFPEFIKYILKISEENQSVDVHFRPMHTLCDPCRFKYDYIGYLETFADDATFLLSKWRQEFHDFTLKFEDFDKEAAIDAVKVIVKRMFSKNTYKIKFPFIKIMLRVWRDLQIRGYLSKTIAFPYSGDVSGVTPDDFMNALVEGLEQPQNRTAVKLQRHEALIEAYRQVPLEDMERLRRYVQWDCALFGYNDRPVELFDRSSPANSDFVYLDGLS